MDRLTVFWQPPLRNAMATAPFHSKYRPFYQVIKDARLARMSWAEIAELLTTKHGVEGAAPSSIYEFFKRGVVGRRVPLGFPEEDAFGPPPPPPKAKVSSSDAPQVAEAPKKTTPAKQGTQRKTLAEVKREMKKPAAQKPTGGWDSLDAEAAKAGAESVGAKRAKTKLL